MNEEDSSKEFAPTEQRLADARRKGEIAIGRDFLAAAAYAGFLLAMIVAPAGLLRLITAGSIYLGQADRIVVGQGQGGAVLVILSGAVVLLALAPLFLFPALAVVAALLAQRGLVLAPTRLRPSLGRISPIAGAKRKFGLTGLVDFGKNTVKLIAIATLLGAYLVRRSPDILSSLLLPPGQVLLILGGLLVEFVALVLVLQLVIGVVDLIWQQFDHRRRLRMTRREMTEEMKTSEGDPQLKARRRQRAQEIAGNRMMADVPDADVVIVNPTHYAVVLKWDRRARGAPRCVAKGVDATAARIRKIAQEAGVPLHHDPATARSLHATVEIGEVVRPDQYRAVAAAIRFAESMRSRARLDILQRQDRR